jgi:hypothetical protein
MAFLDVDLTLPIALLFSALAGVVAVRSLVGRGERRAAARTIALLQRHGLLSNAECVGRQSAQVTSAQVTSAQVTSAQSGSAQSGSVRGASGDPAQGHEVT